MALKRVLVFAVVVLLWPGVVSARDLTPAETRLLEETVEAYAAATEVHDLAVVVETMPPAVRAFLARQMGLDEDGVRELMIREITDAMKRVTLEAFSLSLATAEHRTLGDGTPFVLIPTETVFDVRDRGRVLARSHTLALLEDGKWYLLRISNAKQLLVLREVYPGFAGVELPRGSMEALK